uniref:Beta_elim_lyase domain-containing protein n=1 Tax=Macrostomum lignano TaxID=282301 RepID=A0A1I8FPQ4_9PLAT
MARLVLVDFACGRSAPDAAAAWVTFRDVHSRFHGRIGRQTRRIGAGLVEVALPAELSNSALALVGRRYRLLNEGQTKVGIELGRSSLSGLDCAADLVEDVAEALRQRGCRVLRCFLTIQGRSNGHARCRTYGATKNVPSLKRTSDMSAGVGGDGGQVDGSTLLNFLPNVAVFSSNLDVEGSCRKSLNQPGWQAAATTEFNIWRESCQILLTQPKHGLPRTAGWVKIIDEEKCATYEGHDSASAGDAAWLCCALSNLPPAATRTRADAVRLLFGRDFLDDLMDVSVDRHRRQWLRRCRFASRRDTKTAAGSPAAPDYRLLKWLSTYGGCCGSRRRNRFQRTVGGPLLLRLALARDVVASRRQSGCRIKRRASKLNCFARDGLRIRMHSITDVNKRYGTRAPSGPVASFRLAHRSALRVRSRPKLEKRPRLILGLPLWRCGSAHGARSRVDSAKQLFESAYHPDSGELQNLVGRMSFQVPGGSVLAVGEPVVNALVNYTNRNANSGITSQQLMIAYTSATGSAIALSWLNERLRLPNDSYRSLLLPQLIWLIAALMATGCEGTAQGVQVKDENGNQVGTSRYAALQRHSVRSSRRVSPLLRRNAGDGRSSWIVWRRPVGLPGAERVLDAPLQTLFIGSFSVSLQQLKRFDEPDGSRRKLLLKSERGEMLARERMPIGLCLESGRAESGNRKGNKCPKRAGTAGKPRIRLFKEKIEKGDSNLIRIVKKSTMHFLQSQR